MSNQENNTSSLLAEAFLDAKKFKELALEEAKNALFEEITPILRQKLDESLVEITGNFVEEAEADPSIDATAATETPVETPAETPVQATTDASAETPIQPEENLPTEPVDTQSQVAPDSVPIPGPDGKIVVDLEALFVQDDTVEDESSEEVVEPEQTTPETQPAQPAEPAPIEPAGETQNAPAEQPFAAQAEPTPEETETAANLAEEGLVEINFESLNEAISLIEKSSSEKFPVFINEEIFGRMYLLLQGNKDKWGLNESSLYLTNNRIELLFEKFQKSNNSYTGKGTKQMSKSLSLKEFAKSLIAENAHMGFGDDGKAKAAVHNSNEKEKPSQHAMKASKPHVADPGKKDSLDVPGTALPGLTKAKVSPGLVNEGEEMDELAEAEKQLMEYLANEGDDSMGHDDDATMEEGMDLLEGGLGDLSDEEAADKMGADLEGDAVADAGGDALEECAMDAEPVNVNIEIVGVEPKVSGAHSMDSMGHDHDDAMASLDDLSDDDEVEVVDDEEEGLAGVGEVPSLDSEEEDEEEMMVKPLNESKVAKAAKKVLAENKELKAQILEYQLLSARSLFANKLFAAHELSLKQKQGIVKSLDSARTIAEAKVVYGKLKGLLESKTTRPVTKGAPPSAPAAKPLNESATNSAPQIVIGTTDRWAQLAGISRKNNEFRKL